MFLPQEYMVSNGHCYRSELMSFYGILPMASSFLDYFAPGHMASLTKLPHLLFFRIYMFVKELKNECKNHQRRRNRQGHP